MRADLPVFRASRALAGLVLLGALAACGGPAGSDGATVRDSAGVSIVHTRRAAWADAEAWRLSPEPVLTWPRAGRGEEVVVHGITAARTLADGRVAVASSGTQQVFVVASDGAAQRALGRQGDGPGEFRAIGGLWYARPDSLIVYDPQGGRVTSLGLDGRVRSTTDVAALQGPGFPVVRGRLADGSLLVVFVRGFGRDAQGGVVRDSISLAIRDPRSGNLRDAGRFPSYASYVRAAAGAMEVVGIPFSPTTLFATDGAGYWIGTTDRFRIDRVDASGRVRVSARREAEPRRVAPADVRREVEATAGAGDPGALREAEKLFAEIPVPATMPFFDALLADADGNLWVRAYAPRETEPRSWSVFDSAGRWLGEVTVPARLRLLEIGTEHVLAVATDQDDVERLVRYRLIKPKA